MYFNGSASIRQWITSRFGSIFNDDDDGGGDGEGRNKKKGKNYWWIESGNNSMQWDVLFTVSDLNKNDNNVEKGWIWGLSMFWKIFLK